MRTSFEPGAVKVVFPDEVLPDGSSAPDPAVKMFVFAKKESQGGSNAGSLPQPPSPPTSADDEDPETATTPIQTWSPVSTERSTPPLKDMSATRSNQGSSAAAAPGSPDGDGSSGAGGSAGAKVNRVLSFLGLRTRSVRVAPGPDGRDTDGTSCTASVSGDAGERAGTTARDSAVPPALTSVGRLEASGVAAAVRPSSEQQDDLPSTPSVFGPSSTAGIYGDGENDDAPSPRTLAVLATKRSTVEADVEEGGLHATAVAAQDDAIVSGDAATSAAAAAPVAIVAPAKVGDAAEPAVIENGIVMPCAPSDREKVSRPMAKQGREGAERHGSSFLLVVFFFKTCLDDRMESSSTDEVWVSCKY